MTTSQNGWPAGSAATADVTDFTVPGTSVVLPVNKTCAPLLLHVADQFNSHVEGLVAGTCWGWAYRDIRGSNVISNHASGTAIDLNAPRHPLGTPPTQTFSSAQIAVIHAILRPLNGAIRWGGDYEGRKDPMHFEVATNRAGVLAAIAGLGSSLPAFPGVLREGSTGGPVMVLQRRLNALGHNLVVDGAYGPQVKLAVVHFQQSKKLTADGIVGALTWRALWT